MKCPKCGGKTISIDPQEISFPNIPMPVSAIGGYNPYYLRCVDCGYIVDP